VGATIYFGSEESSRQIQEISRAFAQAHELGLVTVLWCYLRNAAFNTPGKDFHLAADLTGQANHLGVTIEGMGVISGRKAFERPMPDGIKLLNLIQDVYLDNSITVA
jgi:DhnA family fructose-bisphosphate aldolase class Ia